MTKPEHLEAYFLVPLSEVFGVPLPAVRNTLARRCPQGLTPEQLQAAAERIIDTRKARGYPAPVEVLGFLERASSPAQPATQVTAANYAERARAYTRTHDGPVVITPKDSAAWREWTAYFHRLGYNASAFVMADANTWTVPAAFPHQFDPTFPALSPHGAEQIAPETMAHRAAVIGAAVKRFAAGPNVIRDPAPALNWTPPPKTEAEERAEAEERLKMQVDVPPLSDAAKKLMFRDRLDPLDPLATTEGESA
jgi:hypothetical protein